MKSGLEGRNKLRESLTTCAGTVCLNEVRPRRPEQWDWFGYLALPDIVSMKSGLEGRNKDSQGVRMIELRLVSMKSGLEGRNNGVAPKHAEGKSGSQ